MFAKGCVSGGSVDGTTNTSLEVRMTLLDDAYTHRKIAAFSMS